MPIASDITIANLVTEALKNAGRTSPSAQQITDATNYQFRRVKSDIALKSGRHEWLRHNSMTTVIAGRQRYDRPTDAFSVNSVVLLDGPDSWKGTLTNVSGADVTLAATVDESEATLKGKYFCTTGGAGADQHEQILAWDNTTKIATLSGSRRSAWFLRR